jgi:hypothetical protein
MPTTTPPQDAFSEACNGYGFELIEVPAKGTYCQTCCTTHKRPTKMYHSSYLNVIACKEGIIYHFNPQDQEDDDENPNRSLVG